MVLIHLHQELLSVLHTLAPLVQNGIWLLRNVYHVPLVTSILLKALPAAYVLPEHMQVEQVLLLVYHVQLELLLL